MKDYMITAMAAKSQIRAFAVTSGELAEEARRAHNTSPVATAALGRTMSAALLMADMLKDEKNLLTVRFDGDGPIGAVVVTASKAGDVKGYVRNPSVMLPPNAAGHRDVGGAVGRGMLTVIRDLDNKNTYTGQTAIRSGEIAEDLTWYFAESEQVPTSVGLGVLMNKDNTVRVAGGFIIQLMPFAAEEVITALEKNLGSIPSVTDMLKEGMTPEDMLAAVLAGFDLEITSHKPVRFFCGCDRKRVEGALRLLGKEELEDMIRENKDVELACQFCGKKYCFTPEQIREIQEEA